MNRVRLGALGALLVVVAVTVAGCSTPPIRHPAPSAAPPAVGFACPSTAQLSALTAIHFSTRSEQEIACAYVGMVDGNPAEVTIQHPAPLKTAIPSLAASRAALSKGLVVRAATRFSADAFLATATDRSCTAYVYASDGVITAVTARRAGAEATHSCDLAASATALMGTAAHRAVPAVTVVSADGTLPGTASKTLVRALGPALGVDVVLRTSTASGYTTDGGGSTPTMTAAVNTIDPASTAVVLVTGPADAAADRMTFLHDATTALAAAHARAPHARIVVVGPVGAGSAAPAVLALRDEARIAARIAGADFVDPTVATWGSVAPVSDRAAVALGSDLVRLLSRA